MSNSQSHVVLSELAHSARPLTISEIMDIVIPKLLDITASTYINCNEMQLRRFNKFRVDLEYIKENFRTLKDWEQHADEHVKALLCQVVDTEAVSRLFIDDSRYNKLEGNLRKLKIWMPYTKPYGHESEEEHKKLASYFSVLNPFFENPVAFRQLTHSYELLDPLLKKCLLCFSAFPEGAEINKRTVISWWIGEQLIDLPTGGDDEKKGHEILRMLVDLGFLEELITKGRVTSRCTIRPFIRSVLIYLAEAAGFFYYPYDRNDDDNLSHENKCRVFLVETSNPTSSCLRYLKKSRTADLKCIETLFNSNTCYMDIKHHWFCRMKSMKTLYLGRCDSKAIQYIELKSCKFFAGLNCMKGLRLLSLQGVSKIVKLPKSVGSVKDLRILDLRDCHDMEELPDAIKLLKKLTHLDLTGCYSLSCLPKGISCLCELQVLKGFFAREKHLGKRSVCSFQDLKSLKKLRKLNITRSLKSFPEEKDIETLNEMVELRKLKIEWQGFFNKETINRDPVCSSNLFVGRLEKLDLRHIPFIRAPAWLAPDKLPNLKILYMKGSKILKDLDGMHNPGWEVETLRLLHLPNLSMTWTALQTCFPKLIYLEQVECSNLTSIPCDNQGVWQKIP